MTEQVAPEAQRPNVAGAVETTDEVASHLHPAGSFDVDDHPMPNGREEIWRFTPLRRLAGALDRQPTGAGAVDYRVEAPGEVAVASLAPGQAPRGTVLVPSDRAAAIASAETADALHVKVPAEVVVADPVAVTVQAGGGRSNGHVVLDVGPFAKVTLLLDHRGTGVHTANLEVVVGDGAEVTVVSVQDWDRDAVHLGQHEALVGRDASYRHIVVSLGGDVVRLNSNVRYAGTGGGADLYGLYFADAGQHLEHRLFVDHNAPHTRSHVDYKGALQGRDARTVWVGDVLIRKIAEQIETYEINRNLVLTDGAQADSVPNLEIETGEIVSAGHASATGRFDDEQLFYLQSRGITEEDARRLVVRGFFAGLLERIGIETVRDRLTEAIERRLAEVGV
ncbi:Fe-S cluster assembly protein SufD [Stackebrandtia albiflava]|uniref:Fe-S cluster assembly protein SufD n=1 Tax=Stackebrandtia albiflava TaxID=406432 RepID=A0A562VD48_9ACTN|nr:Fe-S cluster assembly protein SufD [Stackebrandtia albiflava]TWJ15813.1 Fe-S cluster assembly protein SufD [Stackebrandtia albiflava]